MGTCVQDGRIWRWWVWDGLGRKWVINTTAGRWGGWRRRLERDSRARGLEKSVPPGIFGDSVSAGRPYRRIALKSLGYTRPPSPLELLTVTRARPWKKFNRWKKLCFKSEQIIGGHDNATLSFRVHARRRRVVLLQPNGVLKFTGRCACTIAMISLLCIMIFKRGSAA